MSEEDGHGTRSPHKRGNLGRFWGLWGREYLELGDVTDSHLENRKQWKSRAGATEGLSLQGNLGPLGSGLLWCQETMRDSPHLLRDALVSRL